MSDPGRPGADTAPVLAGIGDVRTFYGEIVHALERLGVSVSSYPISHVAYRCPSWEDYVSRRTTIERACRANVESMWSGRPISKVLLDAPITLGGRHELSLIELIPPPHNPRYILGLEHLGFVVGSTIDDFRDRHRAVITGRQDQGPYNQPLYIRLDDGRLVKFHQRSLQEVAELEGHRFDAIRHATSP